MGLKKARRKSQKKKETPEGGKGERLQTTQGAGGVKNAKRISPKKTMENRLEVIAKDARAESRSGGNT